jgi:hypothetical protein
MGEAKIGKFFASPIAKNRGVILWDGVIFLQVEVFSVSSPSAWGATPHPQRFKGRVLREENPSFCNLRGGVGWLPRLVEKMSKNLYL